MPPGPIQHAAEFLTRVHGAAPDAPIDSSALVQLERSLQDARATADPFVRVGLVGEFNAGKSTLVNALFRREVAAVDLLEMTSWIAVYRPGSQESCRLALASSRTRVMELTEFHERCRTRAWTTDELADIERVDIELADAVFPCVLVDPPGMGSITSENEVRLVRALGLADVVIWVVDIEAVGGIREVALIERLRREGMPVEVVITKADYADSQDELDDLREYIGQKSGVGAAAVHTVAAIDPRDPGLAALAEHLTTRVAQSRSEVRRRSTAAGLERARIEAVAALDGLRPWLEDAADMARGSAGQLALQAQSVRANVGADMEIWISERLLVPFREVLADRLGAGGTAEDAMAGVIPAGYLDEFWASAAAEADAQIVVQWSAFGVRVPGGTASEQAQQTSSVALASPRREPSSESVSFEAGMKTALGTAAAATAWAAWLGPAAASVTLGAAATGIGIPIALLGAGVAYLFSRGNSARTSRAAAEGVLDEVVREFTQAMLLGPVAAAVTDANAAVLGQASESGDVDPIGWLEESTHIERLLRPRLSDER